jgi:uncharacterized YccA/Bax inhibitor family protein
MALFKSGNPVLKKNVFDGYPQVSEDADVMTIQGTVNKTGFLLFTLIIPALYTWNLFNQTMEFDTIAPYFFIGVVGGLVTGLIISFNKQLSPYLAMIYAAFEGLAIGGISALLEFKYPGIVIESLILTFSIFLCLLVIYKLEIIKATENFKLIVASATSGVAIYYLICFGLSFFGIRAPLINDNSMSGIVFSLIVIVIAAMSLVVDFDFIEQGAAKRVPKYMEWYGAFGLMVTLIWLYLEIIRLLAKSRRK